MSSGKLVISYEELIEKSNEVISNLEFDISGVIIPYSEFINPLKHNFKERNSEVDSYIKNILKQELQ